MLGGPHLIDLVEGLPIHSLALCIVFLQGPVLKSQLFDFFAHHVVVGGRHLAVLVTLEYVNLALQFVVLSVQEVHLSLQLDNTLLVLLVLVLQIDLLKILDGCVKVVEAEDLFVTDLDLGFEVLGELLLSGEPLLHLVQDLVQLVATVICLAHLLGPLILLSEEVLLYLEADSGSAGAHRIQLTARAIILLHSVCKLHALCLLQQIRFLLAVELAQPLDDLVLVRQVNALQILLHLRFQLDLLLLKVSYSLILRIDQELEVLALILELAQGVPPLKLSRLPFFPGLDDLHVQLIVLLRQLLVLFLQRYECLLIQFLIMLYHLYFRLQFLVSLRRLQEIVKELLYELGAFSVYRLIEG